MGGSGGGGGGATPVPLLVCSRAVMVRSWSARGDSTGWGRGTETKGTRGMGGLWGLEGGGRETSAVKAAREEARERRELSLEVGGGERGIDLF